MAFLEDTRRGGLGLAARNHAADDVVWSLPGTTREDPFRTKDEVLAWFDARGLRMFNAIPSTVVERVVVEGNVAAAQIRTQGVTKRGRQYDNRYMFVMTIEGGQVTEMREFFDTKHVQEVIHDGSSAAK
jgi:ketosteroid isomerase-like protein